MKTLAERMHSDEPLSQIMQAMVPLQLSIQHSSTLGVIDRPGVRKSQRSNNL
jgi:hypothetical protein